MTCQRSAELDLYRDEMIRQALRPGSIDKRMSVLVRCEIAIGHPLLDATRDELRDWLDGHKLQAKTRYSYISHLSSFWKWALVDELVAKDLTLRLTRPKLRPGLPRPISTADLAAIIEQAPDAQMRAMVILGGYVGLRCMEIAALDIADVMEHSSPPAILVANGKGGKARVIPVSPVVLDALRAHTVVRHGPVFRNVDGSPYQPWKVSHMLRLHMLNCGVNASAHSLRHSFATEVYRRSGDLLMTQNLLGHASPATTAGYAAYAQDGAAGVLATLFT